MPLGFRTTTKSNESAMLYEYTALGRAPPCEVHSVRVIVPVSDAGRRVYEVRRLSVPAIWISVRSTVFSLSLARHTMLAVACRVSKARDTHPAMGETLPR